MGFGLELIDRMRFNGWYVLKHFIPSKPKTICDLKCPYVLSCNKSDNEYEIKSLLLLQITSLMDNTLIIITNNIESKVLNTFNIELIKGNKLLVLNH